MNSVSESWSDQLAFAHAQEFVRNAMSCGFAFKVAGLSALNPPDITRSSFLGWLWKALGSQRRGVRPHCFLCFLHLACKQS